MALLRRNMFLHKLQNLSLRSVTFLLVFVVILTNEYLVYWVQSWRWPSLPDVSRDPSRELVILLASDPQLIGIQDEHHFPIGTITRWDSDRYLLKTFSLAYNYVQPDIVIFLGDLMDEGSKASASEYESYLHRFQYIFYPMKNSKVLYVPGDNDIGGEGPDLRTQHKISRFEQHFENLTGVVNVHFIDFIKLDLRAYSDSPVEKKQIAAQMTRQMVAPIRIILNHESVIYKMEKLVYPILKLVQPSLIFSGHWHHAVHFVCETCLSSNEGGDNWQVQDRSLQQLQSFFETDFSNLLALNEIMVPTCSYRMGTKSIGYGVAVIRKSGSMQYGILWLPDRYLQLFFYLGALVAIPFVVCFLYFCCFFHRSSDRWRSWND